ncbi:MAG: ATPase, T2SS/T4P/T4SS family [Patescibacteria group bacterium]
MFVPSRELGNFLVDARAISRADLLRAQEEVGDGNLFDVLLMRNMVAEDELRRAAAHVLGVPFREVTHEEIEPDALLLVPEPLARTHSLVVFKTREHEAHVLLLNLDDLAHLRFLEEERHLSLKPHLTDRASIKRALMIHQKHLKERYAQRLRSADPEAALEALLSHAMLSRAQQIYLDRVEGDLRVRYRVGGAVLEAMRLPAQATSLMSRLKELAGLSFTLNTPQEGRFKVELKGGERLRVGVFTLRSQTGESMMLGLASEKVSKSGFTLEALGLHGDSLNAAHEIIAAPSGLVLVASPKAGGKTTTLYTLLDMASGPHGLAMSVEEKIELLLPHVSQVEVKRELGLDTSATLRAALKHSPDVVMIGDIKDEETAALATSAASRGALVFAGIKVASAEKALGRSRAGEAIQKMLSLGVEPLVLAATLRGVFAQHVVRKLCAHCKVARTLMRAEAAPLEDHANFGRVLGALKAEGVVDGSTQWKDVEFFDAKGCNECEDGYKGNVGIFEVLPATAITKELMLTDIGEEGGLPAGRQGRLAGEIPLSIVEDALFKAAAGQTSLDEVASLIEN